jgi:hypothetical protein
MMKRFEVRMFLVVNGGVALLSGGVTLVLLLIAPLGLATVITLTLLVTLICFVGGVAGDLLLWRWLLPEGASLSREGQRNEGRLVGGRSLPLGSPHTGRLRGRRER